MKRVAPVILLAAIAISAHAQPIRYQIGAVIEFPQYSYAYGLSNAGHVVGDLSPELQGFLWKDGQMSLLPPLNGGRYTSASSVNASGQAVGYSQHSSPGVHAALWTDGVPLDLGTLGGRDSGGTSINEAGVVVGGSGVPGTNGRAFIYKDGVMSNLGSLGWDTSFALAINNNNVVVGNLYANEGASSAFIWDEENGMRYLIDQNYQGEAEDVNDLNHVLTLGGILLDGQWITRFDGGFYGYDITNSGWVGGANRRFDYTPAIWKDGNSFLVRDLVDDLDGWELREFQAINDSAHLIVYARRNGAYATLYLEPVPEPATLLGLGSGVLLFVRRRWRNLSHSRKTTRT